MRFNPADYSVTEGEDSNAVITLEAIEDHPSFDFTVTVVTRDGAATREYLNFLRFCAFHQSVFELDFRENRTSWPEQSNLLLLHILAIVFQYANILLFLPFKLN